MAHTPKSRAEALRRHHERMASDPEYRERRRAQGRAWMKKYRATPKYREQLPGMVKARKGDGKSRLYFIQAESGAVKIGQTTKRVDVRMSELQVGNHEQLTLLGSCLGTKQDEAKLHKQFAASRLRAEWFRMTPELLDVIQTRCITT